MWHCCQWRALWREPTQWHILNHRPICRKWNNRVAHAHLLERASNESLSAWSEDLPELVVVENASLLSVLELPLLGYEGLGVVEVDVLV